MSDNKLKLYLIRDKVNNNLMIGAAASEIEMDIICRKSQIYKDEGLSDRLHIEEIAIPGYEITVNSVGPVSIKPID
ncbi:MAG: hypothetical protein ABRQ26_09410 [Syntrophomonadaceae bacterium]